MDDTNAQNVPGRRDRSRERRMRVYLRLFAGESPMTIMEQEDVPLMQLRNMINQRPFRREFAVLMLLAEHAELAVRAQAASMCFRRLRQLAEQTNETGRKAAVDLLALCGPPVRATRSTRRSPEGAAELTSPPAEPTTDLEQQVDALLARAASEDEDRDGAEPSGLAEEAEHG